MLQSRCVLDTLDQFDRLLVDQFSRHPVTPLSKRSQDEQSQPARRKVLVVDDQRLVADTVREILEHAGFEAHATYDPWDAIELAQGLRPDVLLSDVLMPNMNGVDLAIAIQRMHPDARIVLFSGQAGISEILESALSRGHQFELLAKPIHPDQLIAHLRAE